MHFSGVISCIDLCGKTIYPALRIDMEIFKSSISRSGVLNCKKCLDRESKSTEYVEFYDSATCDTLTKSIKNSQSIGKIVFDNKYVL